MSRADFVTEPDQGSGRHGRTVKLRLFNEMDVSKWPKDKISKYDFIFWEQ